MLVAVIAFVLGFVFSISLRRKKKARVSGKNQNMSFEELQKWNMPAAGDSFIYGHYHCWCWGCWFGTCLHSREGDSLTL